MDNCGSGGCTYIYTDIDGNEILYRAVILKDTNLREINSYIQLKNTFDEMYRCKNYINIVEDIFEIIYKDKKYYGMILPKMDGDLFNFKSGHLFSSNSFRKHYEIWLAISQKIL